MSHISNTAAQIHRNQRKRIPVMSHISNTAVPYESCSLFIYVHHYEHESLSFEGRLSFGYGEMDHKRFVLAMIFQCFLILPASVAAATINLSRWMPYSHTHHPNNDHLYSESEYFLGKGRNYVALEEGHGPPSMSMDAHERKDLAALLSFKKHITSDPSGNLSSWTAENSKEICSWYGVTCRRHTRRVVAIILPGWNFRLEGTLSPSLGNLSLLHELDLSFNDFSGGIPPEFGQLKALHTLDLSANNLTGGIPPEFGQLKALHTLDLSTNNLTGGIPPDFGQLKALHTLDLSFNDFSGGIPPEFGQLKALHALYLSANNLTGGIIFLSSMKSLSFLWLGSNHFCHIPPTLANCTQLTELDFSDNDLSGPLPSTLGNCTQLTVLWLSFNYLSGPIPSIFSSMRSLSELYLDRNNFSGHVPPTLGNCTQLSYLDLSSNDLSGPIPSIFSSMRSRQSIFYMLQSIKYTSLYPQEPLDYTLVYNPTALSI